VKRQLKLKNKPVKRLHQKLKKRLLPPPRKGNQLQEKEQRQQKHQLQLKELNPLKNDQFHK